MKLYNGDCLEVMQDIPDNSVDFILTDLPYGTTAFKWDINIPSNLMWEQIKRIRKIILQLFYLEMSHLVHI